jgi:CheY-like chemotaxis protein
MARLLYPDIGDCQALVIDGNPTARSILVAMLRDMGVGQVAQASRAVDARRTLEHRSFDLVLCDYHFDHSTMSGQDLLDELRRAQLLPYSTVFVMVTGEASYAQVAEAAESALDSYLLKPHTAAALEQRVLQARHRKKVLGPIFGAIAEGNFQQAADLCQARFENRGEYWLYAARIGAELRLRLGQHSEARVLYESVRAMNALPWARLGIARAEVEAGQLQQACRTLASLVDEQPSYADAYDVMGRAQLELGDVAGALATYRSATQLTPSAITRLQKQGLLAFFAGESDEAVDALERSVRLGVGSKMFDEQSLMLLALLYNDRRDHKAFGRVLDHLERAVERQPDAVRPRRFLEGARVLQSLLGRQVGGTLQGSAALAAQIRHEDFDFEAATNLLAVLARISGTEIRLPEGELWVGAIAQRFCISKASTDMLGLAARPHPPYETLVRDGQHAITALAEKAMTHSLAGAHEATVRSLLSLGSETLNAKLLDMAGLVLNRHAARIDGAADLDREVSELRRRFAGRSGPLGAGPGRAPGAPTLRA